LAEIVARLDLQTESDHFVLRYGSTTPRVGRGLGASGVRDLELIRCYLDALERAYALLRGHSWPDPRREGRKIQVFVFDVSEHFAVAGPFAFFDPTGDTIIALPSSNSEPTPTASLQRAAAEAASQVAYIFTWRYRPPTEVINAAWQWFATATAGYVERHALPDNADSLRLLRSWVQRPELPLGGVGDFSGSLFIEYLCRGGGPRFLRRLWEEAWPPESPMEALERLLRVRRASSTSPDELFASYCVTSYFVRSFAPDVHARYGGRLVRESFQLAPGVPAVLQGGDDVLPLACRYYRFYLPPGTRRLAVRVRMTASPGASALLHAVLTLVDRTEGMQGVPSVAEVAPGVEGGEASLDLAAADWAALDHAVLTVCGSTPGKSWRPIGSMQPSANWEYSFEALAE
jgi:hypothetical protein